MSYRTTELELAAFLKAKGHRLSGTSPQGKIVGFIFEGDVTTDVEAYFEGAQIPARDLFAAHRGLRAFINQIKQHNNQLNGDTQYGQTRQ